MPVRVRITTRAMLVFGAAAVSCSALWAPNASALTATRSLAGAGAGLAYVTGTASSPSTVWSASASGSEAQSLGLGSDPLLAPNGLTVAASLFGLGTGSELGPALALYSTVPGAGARSFFSLKSATALPLAWSPDSRYLAVFLQSTALRNIAQKSTLEVLDTQTGALATIAHGQIYGASFAPDGSDRLAYARAPSLAEPAPRNIYTSNPDGSGERLITHDGRSLNPIWGSRYLAYDRERRRRNDLPAFQIWLRVMRPGAVAPRRLTNVRVSGLVSGLVPIGFSANGRRLLSEFEGQDTSEAWTVTVASGRARRLTSHRRSVIAAGLSSDGGTVLVDEGFFEEPASNGRIATLPFAGGAATVLVSHGSQGSWTG
jgi:hypothetical protein